MSSPIDLTSVSELKSYLPGMSSGTAADDALLQSLITRASQYILDRTERDTLSQVGSYTERYNGNGQSFLRLRHDPIQSVTRVQIGSIYVPQTPDYMQSGWAIDQDATKIVLIGAPGCFARGLMNVSVSYSAGFVSIPDDVQDICIRIVAQNYKRRDWIDQASKQLQEIGVVSYRSWEVPPDVDRVIELYRRRYIG